MSEQNPLIGKTITAIYLASDKKAIRFDLKEGDPIRARADGDCCSSTWIESLDTPDAILGDPVVSVEDLELPGRDEKKENADGEYIAYYGCKVTTTRGICVIDFRNSSNGYYGGNLSWPTDSYFYGGVYGQNISTEEWQKVASL